MATPVRLLNSRVRSVAAMRTATTKAVISSQRSWMPKRATERSPHRKGNVRCSPELWNTLWATPMSSTVRAMVTTRLVPAGALRNPRMISSNTSPMAGASRPTTRRMARGEGSPTSTRSAW
jgi:hypothetical protein